VAVIEAPMSAEDRAAARTRFHRVPTLVAAFLALLMLVGIGLAAPVAASGGSQADRVIAAVSRHLGARYVWGSTGPRGFDCSGLVYRSFSEAHLASRIGGFNTAHGYYRSFQKRGKTGRTHGRAGDIVVYNRGGHVGIYLGHGKVISALLSGVKVHPLQGINIRFTTFIHLGLSQDGSASISSRARKATYRKAAHTLPLRVSPGRTARSLEKVHKGSRLEVLATKDRGHRGVWIKVRLSNGDKGWARKSLTRKI
jgi:hypothetical protein